jgi:hypothetical protein
MGIQIDGTNDIISAVDGSLSISGNANLNLSQNLNVSGVATATILNVGTGGTVITTTSGGNIGIGTTNSSARLSVDSKSNNLMFDLNSTNTNGGYIRFSSSGVPYGDVGTAYQCVVGGGSSDFAINARPSNSLIFGTSNTERARIDSSGRLLVGTSSATANGGVLQVSNGITFPATQSACSDANTLDDYEEGTWTPTFSSASATFSYSYQSGRYTKIGNTVHLYAYIQASASGTLTNAISISSLPFTPNAGVTAYNAISLDSNSGANHIAGYVNPAASISIDSAPGTSATPSFLGMTSSRWVMLGGSYQT